jgi:hypothetical protein
MDRKTIRIYTGPIALVLILMLGAFLGVANADSEDAAEASSGNMEDHEAHASDPDEMTVDARSPDEMTVESESLDGREAKAGDPDNMRTESGTMNEHLATAEDVTGLVEAQPDAGFEALAVPGKADWDSTNDPAVLVARKNLVRAQKRAEDARSAYGKMMQTNYPRGAARARIVEERDSSMHAFEEAKRALSAAEGGS